MKNVVIAMMLAAASAVPAAAVTITTQTQNAGLVLLAIPGAQPSFNVSFNPFNVANQYLTSVTLSYTAGFSANFNVTNANIGGTPSRQITLVRGISSSLNGNGFSLSDSDQVSKTQTVQTLSILNNFGTYAVQNSTSGTINSGFAPFLGGPVSFTFTADGIRSLTGTPNTGLTLAVLTNPIAAAASATSSFTLTYTSVPEPSSWMMMIIGFGLVGAAARRRVLAIG